MPRLSEHDPLIHPDCDLTHTTLGRFAEVDAAPACPMSRWATIPTVTGM